MYIPSAHRIDDQDLILELMRQNPFATLVTTVDGVPVATHLPVLIQGGEPMVIFGHIARQNQQWKAWTPESESLLIFAGPHGYISPDWYETRPNVPTWNYVSIHVYGRIQIVEDAEASIAHLAELVKTFDPNLSELQPESMSREYFQKLLPGIVAFRMEVQRVDAKAKLNQNKSEVDRQAIRRRFSTSEDPEQKKMAGLMPDILPKP